MTVNLSNWLCDRADTARVAFQRHKRASRESVEAYLEAAAALVEAREECTRRGMWGAVLERASIEPRTARYMLTIARAGASADDIETAGGIRAYRETLARKAEPGSATEADSLSPSERSAPPSIPGDGTPQAHPPLGTDAGPSLSPQARRRAEKRARGECIDCPNPSPDHLRCAECRARISVRASAQRVDARTGAALRERLQEAAARGDGVQISAEEVARLAGRS
ncbi:MAG: hypothetical protein OXU81_15600 [Gammaproteobacteria bacterium]|nr:hypothetical protein [Gammaproteobacteria bacterium]